MGDLLGLVDDEDREGLLDGWGWEDDTGVGEEEGDNHALDEAEYAQGDEVEDNLEHDEHFLRNS